jgi:hypothetical protein
VLIENISNVSDIDYIKTKRNRIVNWVGFERQALFCKQTEKYSPIGQEKSEIVPLDPPPEIR